MVILPDCKLVNRAHQNIAGKSEVGGADDAITYPAGRVSAYEVSSKVNSQAYNEADLVRVVKVWQRNLKGINGEMPHK